MNTYDNLKACKILQYDDLIKKPAGDNPEPLVAADQYDGSIMMEYKKFDMYEYTGKKIYVRDTIAQKLVAANEHLRRNFNARLKIVYGYRHPQVQRRYFERQKELAMKVSEDDMERYIHNFVAVPTVAGHPMGAAVDITLIDMDGNEQDMGTEIANFTDTEAIKTFSETITGKCRANRMRLHDAMVAQGFAPFYGEWWHFSYGDREWAAFYNENAIYGHIDFKV